MNSKTTTLKLGIAASTATALFSGCASKPKQNISLTTPLAMNPPTVIAVKPFDSPRYNKLKPEERGVRDFERSYFVSRCINALKQTAGIQEAYFTATHTPAADFTIDGRIIDSNGKNTSLSVTLLGADGKKVWTRPFSVNISSGQFAKVSDPSWVIWPKLAEAVAKTKTTSHEVTTKRINGYAGNETSVINDKREKVVSVAADVERTRLLGPITKELLGRSALPAVSEKYVTWQKEATSLLDEKSRQQGAAVANGLLMLAGAGLAGANAYYGNTTGVLQSQQATIMASNNIDVAVNRIGEINTSLLEAASLMGQVDGRSLTFTLFGKVYTLSGDKASQQQQITEIVRGELAKVTD